MQSTAGDFWSMMWEKKSHTIVMLSQLIENEKVAVYIALISYTFITGYFIRRFVINTGQMEMRLISSVTF